MVDFSEFDFDVGDALVERAPQAPLPDGRKCARFAGELDPFADQPVALNLVVGETLPVFGVVLLKLLVAAGVTFGVERAEPFPFGIQHTKLVVG